MFYYSGFPGEISGHFPQALGCDMTLPSACRASLPLPRLSRSSWAAWTSLAHGELQQPAQTLALTS